ncbi:hypothetical protein B566_EDAN011586 [Ephemera danica]|nr:hypothetical protein B566_EDAN011586 [Ephemera danica]
MYVRQTILKPKGEDGAEYSFDESEDENEKTWDVFDEEPQIEEEGSARSLEWTSKVLRILKLLFSVLLFIAVLGGGVIAKGSMLFMTSQLRRDPVVRYCDRQFIVNAPPNTQYVAVLPEVERVAWVWVLLFAMMIPELGSFLRSLRVVVFKPTSWSRPRSSDLAVVLVAETCGATGMALLIFSVLPDLDVIKGVMLTNCLCFVPTLLVLLKHIFPEKSGTDGETESKKTRRRAIRITAWSLALVAQFSGFLMWPLIDRESPSLWITPFALFLTSFLAAVKSRQKRVRYSTYLVASLWKMLCLFLAMMIIWKLRGQSVTSLFHLFHDAFKEHSIPIYMVEDFVAKLSDAKASEYISVASTSAPIWLLLIQLSTAYISYVAGKCACRIMVQEFCFATPVTIVVPTSLSILLVFCGARMHDPCAFEGSIPGYLFFHQPSVTFFENMLAIKYDWMWLIWLGSQIWVTSHIWYPQNERLAPTEQIFVRPMYSSLFVDQSLALNRRIKERIRQETKAKEPTSKYEEFAAEEDNIPRVIACATMWHETREEMMGLLKSVMRMDEDHCAHPALQVYKVQVKIEPPKVMTTPYGGQLSWKLPGKTNLIVHLKDSAKIRHKKRWSQVMYMYYFLGHQIHNLPMEVRRKDTIAQNTFLLALDGDIDFQPDAVHKLVDLMKRDQSLGAACGRIHPVGSGVLAWYQKFEYAVGHWLQKATEHVIGCVLCSPGCFSLFRGSALMDTNVMKTYTKTSEEARHYVQYDQVEYCAASDAYTHCPEGFGEFYNQRRRWVPSTMANILDLLGDHKHVVRDNDSISFLYIMVLLGGAILGPGTILLMLVGAFASVFHWSDTSSMVANVIPVIAYMLVCFFAKQPTQITVAMVYSLVYCLVMIAVLIGILVQIGEDGILAPTSIFFFIVAGQFIIAAILHPLEFGCLPYGVIYYVTVPSMYMLLIIYSLFNLNNVSWGTREVPKTPEQSASELQTTVNHGGWKGFFGGFRSKNDDGQGSFSISCCGLFSCSCCTSPMEGKEKNTDRNLDTLVNGLLKRVERMLHSHVAENSDRLLDRVDEESELDDTESLASSFSESDGHSSNTLPVSSITVLRSNELYWIQADAKLENSIIEFIPHCEKVFWKALIRKYLKPIEKDVEKEKRIAEDLKSLRNKTILGFFLLNAMFVMTLILMQMNKEIRITNEYLVLEPIGLLFLISFGIVIFIQFLAMLVHRMDTFLHILSSTNITEVKLTGEEELEKYGRFFAKVLQRPYVVKKVDNEKDGDTTVVGISPVATPKSKRRSTFAVLEQKRTQGKVFKDSRTAGKPWLLFKTEEVLF